jgi:multiple sugar transport system permease protein
MATTIDTTTAVAKPVTKKKRKAGLSLARFVVYAILGVGCLYTLVPFLWMLGTSFKTSTEISRLPPTLLPQHFTIQSYQTIFSDPRVPLARFYLNSIIVSVSIVFLVLFTSSLAGFVFAKYRFWGKDFFFTMILATMMIPFQVLMIPAYLILVRMGLIDSLGGLIIPAATSAFGIFLMRQFIEGIPNELIDSARIDGASEFGIYAQIIMPQMGAALATLGIFQFMGTWNDYLWPLIVISTTEKRTLPIMLSWYSSSHGNRYDLTMAASVLVIIPVLLAYFLFQRWIVRGIALTGFK